MYKLLPPEQKKVVMREYAARRTIVMLIAFLVVIFIAMAGLFPSHLLSKARRTEVLERIRITGNQPLTEDELALKDWLSNFNLKLHTLSPDLDTDRPSLSIEQVLQERLSGISLNSFTWKKADNKTTLLVSGVAKDRQALILFEDNLNSSGHFASVALPVSNLARDKDIDFQVSISFIPTP